MGKTASKKIKSAMKTPEQKADKIARDIGVPEAQLARGYRPHAVTEGGQNIGQTIRILYPTTVDRWLAEGGPGFDEPQKRAADHLRSLWAMAGTTRSLVANYDGVGGGSDGNGQKQQDALVELGKYRDRIPAPYFGIAENVIRFEMPAGTAGSHLARNSAQQQAHAKSCVGFVLSLVAQWKGY